MRIDYTYLNELLQVFLDSKLPTVTWNDFKSQRIEDDHKLVFHIEILEDNNLIVESLKGSQLGIHGISNNYMINLTPWRLSSDGHDFASALDNKEFLMQLKSELKNAPFKVVFEGGQKLLSHYAKKQLDKLLSEDASTSH
ncbi:MAG: DUF2513 domain-containing protein [Robiginitomaculum sp.]|nr:MAG: DUF2513 domain-containing protein [Robiginitomaculum sp.]